MAENNVGVATEKVKLKRQNQQHQPRCLKTKKVSEN